MAVWNGSDSRSKTAIPKECCFGAFFCFDGAEKGGKRMLSFYCALQEALIFDKELVNAN